MSLLIYLFALLNASSAVVVTDPEKVANFIEMRKKLATETPVLMVKGDSTWSFALKAGEAYGNYKIPDEQCDSYFENPGLFICENCFRSSSSDSCNLLFIAEESRRIMLTIEIDDPVDFGPIFVYDGANNTNSLDRVIKTKGSYYFESTGRSMHIRMAVARLRNVRSRWSIYYDTGEELQPINDTKGCVGRFTVPAKFYLPNQQFRRPMKTQCAWYINNPKSIDTHMLVELPKCVPGDEANCCVLHIRVYRGLGSKKFLLTRPGDLRQTSFYIKRSSILIEYFGCLTASPLYISITTVPNTISQPSAETM